jgi:hypothetical protein
MRLCSEQAMCTASLITCTAACIGVDARKPPHYFCLAAAAAVAQQYALTAHPLDLNAVPIGECLRWVTCSCQLQLSFTIVMLSLCCSWTGLWDAVESLPLEQQYVLMCLPVIGQCHVLMMPPAGGQAAAAAAVLAAVAAATAGMSLLQQQH